MSIYRGRSTTEFYLASLLYDSIEDQDFRAVKSLLSDKGADANIILPKPGISPFHLAIGSENSDFAQKVTTIVLEHGGDPNVRSDEGLTPLHIAAAWGRSNIVELLLLCGADPNIEDNCYQTPIDYAAAEDHCAVIKIIKDNISCDVRSFLSGSNANVQLDYALDKIVVNNGQVVGEYELANIVEAETIDLEVLPRTNPNDYVRNWCDTLDAQLESSGLEDLSPKSVTSSVNGSYRYKNVTMYRPKARPWDVPFNSHQSNDFCKFSEKSRESGIVTLNDSALEDDEIKLSPRKISKTKSKDTSSDYCTCTEGSDDVMNQNVYEMSSSSSSQKSTDHINNHIANFENSFISVSEVYRYSDRDEGIVLFEKRILPPANSYETENVTISSRSSVLSSLPKSFDYDTDTLHKELTCIGFEPGPITKSTKRVYLRKLYNLQRNPLDNIKTNSKDEKVYSWELQKTLNTAEWNLELLKYKSLEEIVSKEFSNPDVSRRWREGVKKSSFTYLLLDPRVTKNLPCRTDLSAEEKWKIFITSIFYVGKGKRSRPYQHLYDAVESYSKTMDKQSEKIQHILDIWNEGYGVVCLHVFQNVIPVEAYTREAAMINAIKLTNLKNAKSGQFYGMAATWNEKQKRMLGVYLLYKAMKILLNEGERQLSPSDID